MSEKSSAQSVSLAQMQLPKSADTITLLEALALLWHRRFLIALFVILGGLVGLFAGFWIRPQFTSDVLLQVNTKGTSSKATKAMGEMGALLDMASPADAEIELIKSRMVLSPVVNVEHLNLVASPKSRFLDRLLHREGRMDLDSLNIPKFARTEKWVAEVIDSLNYVVMAPEGYRLLKGSVGELYTVDYANDSFSIRVSLMRARPGQKFVLREGSPLSAERGLAAGLRVSEKGKQTGIISVRYSHRHPDRAASILNTIAKTYLRQNVELRSAEAEKTLEFLEKQLPDVKAQMDSSLLKFNAYRNKVGSVDINAETRIVLENRTKLQQDLLELQQKKQSAIRLFQPEHPTIKTLEEQELALKRELALNSNETKKLPSTQQEVLRLTNEVDMSKIMYTTMLNNIQQLKLVSAGEVGSVRIVDFAEQVTRPTKPKKTMIVFALLFLGFLFGATVVILKGKLSNGVKDAHFIERETGFSVYAKVPKGNPKGTKGTRPLAVVEPDDVAVESLRALRSSLEFSMEEGSRPIIGVSGLIPGVGKSFISVNLAALCAGLGKKVLLIDADLRKGRLHKEFGIKRGDGLSQYLLRKANLDDIIHTTEVKALFVMPCGNVPSNPSEILGSKHYSDMIDELEKKFDLIIVDTPPIMLVTDAALACRQASQIVMVIEYNKHSIDAILDGMKQLLKGNSNAHASFVINKYEHGHSDGFGYKYGKY